jgi:hypothetical protein
MKDFFTSLVVANGYKSLSHAKDSIFHPDNFAWMGPIAGIFATIAHVFEGIFGLHIIVFIVLTILFFLEMHTGIKASKLEGIAFNSEKFQKGWFKLAVYVIMIGSMHLCAVFIPHHPIFGVDINIYAFFHYAFYNYVILNLFISNIENFVRLGWNLGGFIPWMAKKLNLEIIQKEKENKPKK